MSSRITQGMMSTQLIRNLNQNMSRLDNLQNQLSTGRKINKPSDDPVGISYSMRYRSELSANEQYQKNADTALSWLNNTDTTLGQVGNVLQRVRELSVQAANGTNPLMALDAIKEEVIQLHTQLKDIGNTDFNGKFIFNGEMTDIPPYGLATIVDTDHGVSQIEIGVGVKIGINVAGNQVFGHASDPDNAFKVLDDIIAALDNGDSALMSSLIAGIDSRLDTVLRERSSIGAKTNRLELAGERLKDININLQSLQSKTEDADMAEVITNLKMGENVYQASLSVGSKLIRPSLIDFLR
jgi:flagellar hook-associated protein 3 FlgL